VIKRLINWIFNWPDNSHPPEMTEDELFLEWALDDLFLVWAFGYPVPADDYMKMKAWNERHGNLLILEPHGTKSEDAIKMYALYVEYKRLRMLK
jgi:hypothetical protein